MNKKKNGFSLIELIIAMSLSAFIITSLMQSYRSLIMALQTSNRLTSINKKVALLFNQIERDITCAFIPPIIKEIEAKTSQDKVENKHEETVPPETNSEQKQPDKESEQKNNVTPDKESDKQQEEAPIDKKNHQEEDAHLRKSFFSSIIYEDEEPRKINDKRLNLFKTCSLITTNALQVYGNKKKRIVRVKYELIKDKNIKNSPIQLYQLIRKETFAIEDHKMNTDDDDNTQKHITHHVVADNIEFMSLYFISDKRIKEEKTEQNEQNENVETIETSSWHEEEQYHATLPQQVILDIIFYDPKKRISSHFSSLFPILSYRKNQKNNADIEKESKKSASKNILLNNLGIFIEKKSSELAEKKLEKQEQSNIKKEDKQKDHPVNQGASNS